MERQIGERFDYKGVTLEVSEKEDSSCTGCFFAGLLLCRISDIMHNTGYCGSANRKDEKMVFFKDVEP